MSIFDKLKNNQATQAKPAQTNKQPLNQKVTFTFRALPESLAEL